MKKQPRPSLRVSGNILHLDDRQLASVLGGLRLLQATPDKRAVHDIITDGMMFQALDAKEIDALCAAINGSPLTRRVAEVIETIDAAGGIDSDDGGLHGAEDWPDLAREYEALCKTLGIQPMVDGEILGAPAEDEAS